MRLRSFTGTTLPAAMNRVREALGPDAVILSTQPVDSGGGIRVTAAVEDSPFEELGLTDGGGLQSIDDITEALAYHRLPRGLFDRLVGNAANLASPDPIMVLAGALDSEFAFAPLPDVRPPRPIMVVGPHGAGKTATAAKLCARARLQGGTARLITMDTGKSGGLAQATAFARALGAILDQAEDSDALRAKLDGGADDQTVIIDTAGANAFADADLNRLSRAAKATGAGLVLVLPAGGDTADAAETAVAFAGIGADRMIATRLDAARRLGGILSASQAGSLALVAVGASPHIGTPLLPINPVSLARLLFPGRVASKEEILAREAG